MRSPKLSFLALFIFCSLIFNQSLSASITADFYATPTHGEPGLTVQFTNTTEAWQDSVISWYWEFGDGSTSSEIHPVHVYTEVGAYTVKLTVTGYFGGMDTEIKENYIRVLKVNFEASPTTEGYAPLTTTFLGWPTGYAPELGDELFWDFGDGSTITGDSQPDHTYLTPGFYDVTFQVINNGVVLEEEFKQNYIHVKLKINSPPFFTDISRTPACPKSNEAEKFFASVDDSDGVVSGVLLFYSDEQGDLKRKGMEHVGDHYEAVIPPSRDGTFVKYFFQAIDSDSLITIYPDTSKRMLFYTVRDSGLTIRDLQYTPFLSDISGYEGLEVTVKGIVTCDPQDYRSFLFIQEGPVGRPAPWSGIMVRALSDTIKMGDIIEVTGTVEEFARQTLISNISKLIVKGSVSIDPVPSPHPVPFLEVNTGVISIDPVPSPLLKTLPGCKKSLVEEREAYEGMLLMLRDVTVVDPFPDSLKQGDFIVDDGSGPVIIGSHRGYIGNSDSTFQQGDNIDCVIGILVCENNLYKILPRNANDVIVSITGVKHSAASPRGYRLYQNYPNPFNPTTTIRFDLPEAARVKVVIYNVIGIKICELVNGEKDAGSYAINWNGKVDSGRDVTSGVYFCRFEAQSISNLKHKFAAIRKMIFMK